MVPENGIFAFAGRRSARLGREAGPLAESADGRSGHRPGRLADPFVLSAIDASAATHPATVRMRTFKRRDYDTVAPLCGQIASLSAGVPQMELLGGLMQMVEWKAFAIKVVLACCAVVGLTALFVGTEARVPNGLALNNAENATDAGQQTPRVVVEAR
jgi:hypothetical protein